MGRIIGIDLGTTFSAAAYVQPDGKPAIITNAEGERTTPSIVAFAGRDILVGRLARQQAVLNPGNTIRSIKRHMGEDGYAVRVGSTKYLPQEISALILRKIRNDAESYLGETVDSAVIAVPAYFSSIQKAATKEAGEIAGLDVRRVLDEPTAAAIAYGINESGKQTILVFDLGGGTFDVSLLKLVNGRFSVITTNGDNFLGGDDFDQRVVAYLKQRFLESTGVNLDQIGSTDKTGDINERLLEASELAKRQLSTMESTRMSVPFIVPEKGLNLDVDLTRAQLEEMCSDLIDRMNKPLLTAFSDARMKPDEIDIVVLCGGMTRMPRVRRHIEELIGKRAVAGVNPDECVALGAAIAAERGTRTVTFKVTRSMGIEIVGGEFSPLLRKGMTLPAMVTEEYTTSEDSQTAINFPIYQGEAKRADDNIILGELRIDGIEPAPRGVPRVEVCFEMSTEGILRASARNVVTSKTISVDLEGALMSEAQKKQAADRVGELAARIRRSDKAGAEQGDSTNG
ncbi:MAG TPA: Hsp70 family protein [Candidatus Brocadiia bacterium]|nr:Hsp70 family protein [Candidatus Brocadiia bacterium]